jgi:hypothetical protein
MDDGKYCDLVRRLVHHIDNDVRRFHEFARPFNQAWPPDMRQARNCKPINASDNPPDQFGCGARTVLGNPVQSVVDIAGGGLADDNLIRRGGCAAAL